MNINAMMAQAKKMQAEIEKAKEELAKEEFKIEKQGVTLVVYGNKRIKSIDINEILIDPEDKETLEDLMIIAFNDAIEIIEAKEAEASPQVPNGMPF